MSAKRGYAGNKYAIELTGIQAGWVGSVEGGMATADVISEKMGNDKHIRKHLGNIKYEDITVSCGTGMSKGFYEWIKASFDNNYGRKSGAIITADYNMKELSRLDFHEALISEIGFPALDAASKDAAKMTIKISPEFTRMQQKSGASVAGGTYANKADVQKRWSPANFILDIAGLDCTKVSKVEAITLKQKIIENPTGEQRDYEKEPAHLEIPNLVITMQDKEEVSKAWYDWYQSFVIDGKAGQQEKSGSLTYRSTDKQNLFRIDFRQLGIFKLTREKVEAGAEKIASIKIEMYCEEMDFKYEGIGSWA